MPSSHLLPPVGGFGNDPGESVTASESLTQRLVAGGHTVGSLFFFPVK